MANILSRKKTGLAPGTIVYEGDTEPKETKVAYYKITNHDAERFELSGGAMGLPEVTEESILWLRVSGLANIALITAIGLKYGVNNLTLEDVLETSHRPKWEDVSTYTFLIMKQLSDDTGGDEITINQLSMIIGKHLFITFEETESEELNAVVRRAVKSAEAFHTRGAGYLAYAAIDTVVDTYLSILDNLEVGIEDVQDEMVSMQDPIDTEPLFRLKRRINTLHRSTRNTFEIVDRIMRQPNDGSSDVITSEYLKDLADHAIRLNDNIQNSKEALNAIYDENMSRMQLRTNNVINVLTIFSVLLLPPMVIAGIYGMNFEFIPMLSWKYGSVMSIVMMCAFSGGLLLFFKKNKYF